MHTSSSSGSTLAKREVPSLAYFRHSFPEDTYRLPTPGGVTTAELLEWSQEDRRRSQLEVAGSELYDRMDAGQYAEAHAVIQRAARIREAREFSDVFIYWDSDETDVELRINRDIKQGVVTGIPELDEKFMGWQPGDLVTLPGHVRRQARPRSSCCLRSRPTTFAAGSCSCRWRSRPVMTLRAQVFMTGWMR